MDDLRYPIGPFDLGKVLEVDRDVCLCQLAEAPGLLRAAVEGLTPAQLDTPYRPGGWTVRQVVHHLADAHMNWYARTKLAITELEPTIKPYDESRWAELEDARTASMELSLTLFDSLHTRWVQFFHSLAEADWSRKFNHPERGMMSVAEVLPIMAWHARHHTAHITGLRERMGWKSSTA
jgi:uncharacterized damage-inducible protein DinB